MKAFFEDLKREGTSIKDTIRLMEKEGYKYVSKNRTKDYDLKFIKDGKEYTIEVKQDFSCYRTGNIGVEYSCRGKDSGIITSKSDFYIYKVHQNVKYIKMVKEIEKEYPKEMSIFLIDKDKLKSCIEQLIDQFNQEDKDGVINLDDLYESPKPKFYKREVLDLKTKTKYNVVVRNINGGDIGSNSLNIIFDRYSFVRNFVIKVLETRDKTEEESKDLEATLNNSTKRYYARK